MSSSVVVVLYTAVFLATQNMLFYFVVVLRAPDMLNRSLSYTYRISRSYGLCILKHMHNPIQVYNAYALLIVLCGCTKV